MASRLVRWIPVLLVVGLVGAAMLAAASSQIIADRTPRTPGDPPPPPDAPSESAATSLPGFGGGDPTRTQLPGWIGYALVALCLAFVLVLVGALLWALLRDRLMTRMEAPEVVDPEEVRRRMREQVRAAVDEGLSDLDIADTDPRRAVIACWVRLEKAAAAAGTEREIGDTSTDLVQRVLADHAVSAPVLAGLAAIYREARFATHVVDDAMRDQARAALRQLRDELVADVQAAA